MLRLLADENLNGNIVRGIRRRLSNLDLVRVQDLGYTGADDPAVLALAAGQDRVLLTHDVQTLVGFALQRLQAGLWMSGVIVITAGAHLGRTIEDLVLAIEGYEAEEMEGRILYLPF